MGGGIDTDAAFKKHVEWSDGGDFLGMPAPVRSFAWRLPALPVTIPTPLSPAGICCSTA